LHLPERLEFLVASRTAPPALLVCNIEESQVRSQSPIADVHAYVEFEDDPTTELAGLLARTGLTDGRIGIEAHRLPASALRTLQERLPAVEWVAVDRALERLQIVKTAGEIDRLAWLARALLSALDDTIAALGAGASEYEYGGELVSRVARTGALPLFMVFAAGPRTTLGHPEPGRSPLEPGTIWRTDFGARLGGLGGDVARTGVVGSPSPEQVEIFAAVRAAQDAAVALAEPGRPARELYEACRRTFERNRLPFAMPHVGHGLGIGLHEAPLLEPRNDAPLAAGTVLNIEPFLVLGDRGEGYHTEDMVLVSADGPERVTTPQDALLVID
jgi:Xaa-Pro aminopeptidase